MANHVKIDPVGIDLEIQDIQRKLYERLGFQNIDGYGRAYIIEKDGEKVPAHYLKGTDYKELLIDDRITGLFFFIPESNTSKDGSKVSTDINLYFFMNIEIIKPDVAHRPDEEVKSRIIEVLDSIGSFQWDDLETDLEKVREFKNDIKKKHRFLFLKFTGTLRYQFNC